MPEKVSIVLPVYNGSSYIRRCIQSIVDQTFQDWFLYVVDDSSDDDTVSAAMEFTDSRISVVENHQNAGPAGNWNRATNLATGTFFKLMCQDDALLPQCLQQQVNVLEANPEVVLVAAKRQIILSNGRTVIRKHGVGPLTGQWNGREAIRRCVIDGVNYFGEPPAVMVRTSSLPSANPWRAESGYYLDFDVWSKILSSGDSFGISEPLAIFRVHAQANSVALYRDSQMSDAKWMFQEIAQDPRHTTSHADAEHGYTRIKSLVRKRHAAYIIMRLLGYK